MPRVKNFNVAVTEENGQVIFLRKIVPGGVDQSYGIHVARLAGLPRSVIHRAQEVLAELESNKAQPSGRKAPWKEKEHLQMTLFTAKSEVEIELANLDVNSLSPLEALTRLYELQKKIR